MKRTLSVSEWRELAREGTALPMRILIDGVSMFPLVRRNRDYVTILPLEGMPEVGDVVLFADPNEERYVLHRLWKLRDGMALTWGDNCDGPDGWLPLESIWGKAVLIERGRRRIAPNPRRGMRMATIWHPAGWIYRRGIKAASGITHRLRRLGK